MIIQHVQPIYHYTKIESGLNILFEKKICLNDIGKTNDPRESRPWELPPLQSFGNQNNPNKEKIIEEANEMIRNDIPKVMRDEWKVVCFTLDAENYDPLWNDSKALYDALINPGYARPRMWAQYAEDHKGMCLLLDKNLFEKIFNRNLESNISKVKLNIMERAF